MPRHSVIDSLYRFWANLDQDQQKCQMTDLSCPKHYYARPSSSNDPAPARVREANGPTMVSIADKRELRQAYLESSKSAAIVEPSKKRTCKEAPTSYLNIHANNSRSQERRTQQSVAVMIKSTNVDENQRNMCGVCKSDILISRRNFDQSKKAKLQAPQPASLTLSTSPQRMNNRFFMCTYLVPRLDGFLWS